MTESKRKLIYFWSYLDWGGAQIYMIAIMKVAKPDWDILVVLPRASSPEILRFLDQNGIAYDFIEHNLDMRPATTIGRKIARQVNRIATERETLSYLKRFDLSKGILHIEAAPWQSWIMLTLLRLRNANVFVTLHNAMPGGSWWRKLIWKIRMQFVSRLKGFHIFSSNQDTKDKFRGYFEEGFWEKIKVTYTCVNPIEIESALASAGDRTVQRRNFGLAGEGFIVLCVAQFVDRKGRWTFLEAAKIVAETHSDVDFVWVTPKPATDDEQARIDGFGLGERFKLVMSESVGQNRVEILRFFRIGDVFAHPSVVDGLPIAILEGMAMGLPTIATNVFAIPEAVKHEDTGLLIECGNAHELANAIVELKTNTQLREQLAAKGQKFVLENFDERVAAGIAISAYKECFADGG